MPRYTTTVETAWDRETAFAYLADFANIADWDPGVARAKRLTEGPLAAGARFEVTTSYMGRESTLVYETIEIEAPRRVLLRAETGTFTSLDELTFDPRPGGGTLVTYDADLGMKGLAKLAELPMRLAFRRIGDAARDGLRTRLADAPPERSSLAKPAEASP
jgi:carbon monoxide dehydrogenase subunit G